MAAPAAQPAAPSADPLDAETSRPLTPQAVVRRGEPIKTRELRVLATLAWLPDYQEETERAGYAVLGAGQGWSRWLLHCVHRDGLPAQL